MAVDEEAVPGATLRQLSSKSEEVSAGARATAATGSDGNVHRAITHQGRAESTRDAVELKEDADRRQEMEVHEWASRKWWSDDQECRARRKLDIRIMPLIFVTYGLAFLDRSNIGNANTAGLSRDLGMSDSQYQWLLTIFYVAYLLFQFLLLGYKILPPHVHMSACVFVWGLASMLQAAAFNWSSMMAARFFMAAAEAGFGTGVALYLSFFYPRTEIGIRFAWYATAGAIASAFGGALAYGIVQTKSAVPPWRLLFIIEAAPTLLMSVFIFFLLPDSIEASRFLTQEERNILRARLFSIEKDLKVMTGDDEQKRERFLKSFDWDHSFKALKDPLCYMNSILFFIVNVGYGGIPVYLPTILSGAGFSSLRAQGLTAPLYLAAFLVAVCIVRISDRVQLRGPFVAILAALGAVGYFWLATLDGNWQRYGVLFLVTVSLFTYIPICYMWLLNNSNGESKKGFALTIFGTIGQCGPLLGTRLFPSHERPYYRKGMWISAGLLLFAVLLASSTSVYLAWVNKKRDRAQAAEERNSEHGAADENERGELAEQENERRIVDIAQKGEDSIYFRYTL